MNASSSEAPIEPVVQPPLAPEFGWRWRLALAAATLGLIPLLYGLWGPLFEGIGTWGTDIPYVWGFDLANYAWWIGIANGASLFASILVLRKHNLRTATNRFAEAVAVVTIFAAAIYPVIHVGKPWLAYWMFPYVASTGLWPQYLSPLTWDFWAIFAHVIVTTLFWYIGLIPDLATLRDRAQNRTARRLYGFFAIGWRGSVRHWAFHQRALRLVAISVIPMIFVMQSAVAFEFSTTLVPDWHSTRQPLHFVVTGFQTGLAAVLLLAHLLRRGLRLQQHIDDADIDLIGRLVLANALATGYVLASQVYLGLLGAPIYRAALLERMFGGYAALFWAFVLFAVAVPLLLLSRRARHSPWTACLVAAAVLVGVWLDRLSIVVAGISVGRLDAFAETYGPSFDEWMLLLGTVALAALLLLLFARLLPVISLYETRRDEHLGLAS